MSKSMAPIIAVLFITFIMLHSQLTWKVAMADDSASGFMAAEKVELDFRSGPNFTFPTHDLPRNNVPTMRSLGRRLLGKPEMCCFCLAWCCFQC